MHKNDFEVVGPEVLELEKGIWPKSEQWNCREDFQEVYELPHAVRFGAYTDRLVGFTMGMPTEVAKGVYQEDDGSPTDKSELIPDHAAFLWVVEVAPNWRNRKVGTALIDHVEDALGKKGFYQLYAYLREPLSNLCGRNVVTIASVENYAGDTGKTYYLSQILERMRL